MRAIKSKQSESTFVVDQGSLRSKLTMNRKLRGSVDANMSKANQKHVVQSLMDYFFENND